MEYTEIKSLLKTFLMNQYDIRPSLAEKAVEVMFLHVSEFISLEEQKEKDAIIESSNHK